MGQWQIDINSDVGEGIGNEASLFPLISSCNIACGGHAGDDVSMREIVRLAKTHHIRVGAHPSYPDRQHFGRVSLALPQDELQASIHSQLSALLNVLGSEDTALHHVKAHGALYNDMMTDRRLACCFLEVVFHLKSRCSLYVPYGSVIAEEALKQGFDTKLEAFADRRYRPDYKLVSRKIAGAVITRPEEVLKQLAGMVRDQTVNTLDGRQLPIQAQTYCIHGDTPSAFQILAYLGEELPNQGIYLEK